MLLAAGCGPSVDPEIAKWRDQLLLTSEPSGAVGIVEAKEHVKEAGDVVLQAQVTSGEHAVWESGRAVFAVSEILEEEPGHGGEGHDPSTCPFCKRRQAALIDTRAMVQVVDEQGKVVPMDARKLLAIKENQQLVVRGKGEIDSLGNLIVSAERIYVRK